MTKSENPENKTSDLLRSMKFPTDAIKVRDLVDRYPSSFDWDVLKFCSPNNVKPAFEDLMNAMHLEREIAVKAAEKAGHVDVTKSSFVSPRSELIEQLDYVYERLGLSCGTHETNELVRQIESSAVALFDPSAGRIQP